MKSMALKKEENRPKLGYRDYVLFPDDRKRHEIIDGEHFMSPSPRTRHQQVSMNLALIIANFLKKEKIGKIGKIGQIFYAPCDVILSDCNIVVPDLVYISRENKGIITKANIQGSPDLIVEILSPSNKSYDRLLKKGLYEAFGVKEYWIVDLDEDTEDAEDTVEVYSLSSSGKFPAPEVYTRSQVLKTKLIPGLEIQLDEVFAE
jgi:Uma2 family endonuclease